jgi:hypothetical protein
MTTPAAAQLGNDDAPAAGTREASDSTPTIRGDPGEINHEAVTSDIRIGAAGVSGDRRDDAEHRLARRNRNQA